MEDGERSQTDNLVVEDKSSDSSVDLLAHDFEDDVTIEQDDFVSGDEFADIGPQRDSKRSKKMRRRMYAAQSYADASRLLRSKVCEEDDENFQFKPFLEENSMILKTIMVGNDYQAQIPEGLSPYGDARPYENLDKLLWDPSRLSDEAVEDYLRKFEAIYRPRIPLGKHLRDSETALRLLLLCGCNVEEALRRVKMNKGLYEDKMQPWSEEECRNFESGIRLFGKNFYLTQQNKVRTRSVGELVQFYYVWKKTERHDVFANKVRLEKKKYILHPGVTDFMDRFLEDHDSRERSSSPSVPVEDTQKIPKP